MRLARRHTSKSSENRRAPPSPSAAAVSYASARRLASGSRRCHPDWRRRTVFQGEPAVELLLVTQVREMACPVDRHERCIASRSWCRAVATHHVVVRHDVRERQAHFQGSRLLVMEAKSADYRQLAQALQSCDMIRDAEKGAGGMAPPRADPTGSLTPAPSPRSRSVRCPPEH